MTADNSGLRQTGDIGGVDMEPDIRVFPTLDSTTAVIAKSVAMTPQPMVIQRERRMY